MSTYTTGEIAKLCGVTVRTVQYYDTRKILVPDQLSEGGRRLYSEDSLKQMKADPKEMTDFSVESIGDIAITMRNKKSLKKVHQTMLALGIPMNNGTTLLQPGCSIFARSVRAAISCSAIQKNII